jgi:hypothetical protein
MIYPINPEDGPMEAGCYESHDQAVAQTIRESHRRRLEAGEEPWQEESAERAVSFAGCRTCADVLRRARELRQQRLDAARPQPALPGPEGASGMEIV